MEKEQAIFVKGMSFDVPENAPSYVKGRLGIKVADIIPFLQEHQKNNGWVNIDLKVSQNGKAYAQLNTWTPSKDKAPAETKEDFNLDDITNAEVETVNTEDIPF